MTWAMHSSLRAWILGAVACLAAGQLGCVPRSEGDSADAGDGSADNHDANCRRWQASFCKAQVRCGAADYAACYDSVDDIVCGEAAELERCARDFDGATECADVPAGCDAIDVSDGVDARAKCNDFKMATCDWYIACNPGYPKGACLKDLDPLLDCARVYSVEMPEYQACLEDIPLRACSDPELPASCQNVLWSE